MLTEARGGEKEVMNLETIATEERRKIKSKKGKKVGYESGDIDDKSEGEGGKMGEIIVILIMMNMSI